MLHILCFMNENLISDTCFKYVSNWWLWLYLNISLSEEDLIFFWMWLIPHSHSPLTVTTDVFSLRFESVCVSVNFILFCFRYMTIVGGKLRSSWRRTCQSILALALMDGASIIMAILDVLEVSIISHLTCPNFIVVNLLYWLCF